ncbi:excinuclease ABC subunit A [Tannerella sp. AM09-19]|jgi:excinuclease ABC subunit A|uniref:excinuclease ABC subunit UvrA n=1 Tax=Coprobacter fastidiosus TaxID=1099853 RepID=UPI000EFFF637|nr:excinuclease ABC subunit UvrA [Coprobacter fastidiosus]RHO61947.1 excinuclease ABC subunit A [Tannerella sp. AM09-19]
MTDNSIFIKGARVNNLKNIDIEIPRDKLIVITGLSGSGKSSLAFDTLYAEGQRRYVESLSAYARQFLGRMSKPECDFIKGIPPAIAIEQKVNTRNPRSTVGTSTEIYDYLRLLYARIGKTISPISGKEVKKHQTEDIIRCVSNYPEGTRFSVLTTLHIPEGRTLETQLEILLKEGYNRVEYKEKTIRIEEIEHTSNIDTSSLFLIIDRMTVSSEKNTISRLADSAETAFFEGGGECILKFYTEKGIEEHTFSKRFEADGITFEEPNDLMFSFNSPVGACPTCEGFGKVIGIDENLVIPNKALSVFDDAVMCWKGEKMSEWKKNLIRVAEASHFPIHRPYYQLTEREKELLWNGNHLFGGIHDFFKMLEENQYKIQYRVMLARYRGKTVCPDCKGGRLKPQAQYVKIGGKSISELVALPITDLKIFFDTLALDEHDSIVAKRLLTEIKNRIGFLVNVGLGYLTLNRLSSTLSGGESQRINLATSLGSSLVGSLYILDEPSIGLHSRDTTLLIKVLRELQALGNTVIVVEHDEEIIRAADYIIDIGPKAGRLGGEVVYQGDLSKLEKATKSYTVRYLTGEEKIETPAHRRKWNNYIKIEGAAHNNLKGIDVIFPLHIMTVVTGVSGSGKSSLVRDVFFKSLSRFYEEDGEQPGIFNRLSGDMHLVKHIEFVDQNPIGKSSRSNPATYLKAFDEIRKLYADQQAAKQMGFTPAYFSFNVEGGRCEECKGDGTITVEMQFMADITLTCESCHGKRFKQDILEIEYRGKNINDVLEMTINQAIEFFSEQQGSAEKKIIKRLKPLQDVGLGYIKLGQASSTLSGGENQRVKLAYFLSNEKQEPTIFVFDEPTTGLHFHDIKTLLKAFDSLIEKGHTVVIIEHNMDVIKCADYVIDMGPEGGDKGGFLVCAGTPEEIASCEKSYTGKYLKDKL